MYIMLYYAPNVVTGHLECPIAWIPEFNLRSMPKEDCYHHINQPISLEPFRRFLTAAEEILQANLALALLAWSAMYSINNYQWTVEHLCNFNIPILYGEPMAGKTLIAS